MDKLKTLESVIRQEFANVVWSHKIQTKQSDLNRGKYSWLKWIDIITAGITSAGLIAVLIVDAQWAKISAAVCSFISFCVTTFLQTFNLQTMAEQNEKAANDLWVIRERLIVLLTKIKTDSFTFDQAMNEYETILGNLGEVYKEAPETTPKAVKKAREALFGTNDNTYSEMEIDHFLPFGLRSK